MSNEISAGIIEFDSVIIAGCIVVSDNGIIGIFDVDSTLTVVSGEVVGDVAH